MFILVLVLVVRMSLAACYKCITVVAQGIFWRTWISIL